MSSINSVTISGFLGKEPELKEFNSGTKKVVFSVAVSEPVKSNGSWENKTTWVLCEFWGKDAEFIDKFGSKGAFIVVNGRLTEDVWEKDGATQRKMYVKGNTFQLPRTGDKTVVETKSQSTSKASTIKDVSASTFDENIPF